MQSGADIHGSMVLETTWSIIPFVVSMTIFLGGAIVFFNQYTPPEDAMDGLRRRQAVDVEDAARDRPARDQRASRAGRARTSS